MDQAVHTAQVDEYAVRGDVLDGTLEDLALLEFRHDNLLLRFEFGLDEDGNIVLGDEVLTPDSSRFWPLEGYEAGKPQPSYDKQFVRDWLKANPDSDYKLPQDVIDKTIAKYVEAYKMITGKDLD